MRILRHLTQLSPHLPSEKFPRYRAPRVRDRAPYSLLQGPASNSVQRANNEYENPETFYASAVAVTPIRRSPRCAKQQGIRRNTDYRYPYDRQMRFLPHTEWQRHDATTLVSPHDAGSLGGSDQTNGPPQRLDDCAGGSEPCPALPQQQQRTGAGRSEANFLGSRTSHLPNAGRRERRRAGVAAHLQLLPHDRPRAWPAPPSRRVRETGEYAYRDVSWSRERRPTQH